MSNIFRFRIPSEPEDLRRVKKVHLGIGHLFLTACDSKPLALTHNRAVAMHLRMIPANGECPPTTHYSGSPRGLSQLSSSEDEPGQVSLNLATHGFPQSLISITTAMEPSSQGGSSPAVPTAGTACIDIVKQVNQRGHFDQPGYIGLDHLGPTGGIPTPERCWTSTQDRDSQSSSTTAATGLSRYPPGPKLVAAASSELEPEPEPELTAQPAVKSAPASVDTDLIQVASRPLSVLFPARQDLLIFNHNAGDSLKQRFNDILDRLEEPLLRHVYKPNEQHQPISIRFGYLGVSELQAQPSMIVFCSEDKGKKVWKFFKKLLAKELLQPPNNEFPTLKVYVVGARP